MSFPIPAGHHLGQINVATALYDLDAPEMADFMGALAAVNAIAERSEGFVWRLQDDTGEGATSLRVSDDPRMIVQMSVWSDVAALEHFVWNTVHAKIFARRSAWFRPDPAPALAFWFQPADEPATLAAGYARLEHLRRVGPSDHAFGWAELKEAGLWRERR